MTQTETWTIGRLLEWTTEFLKSKGSESPQLDAQVLLAAARGCERIHLFASYQDEADEPLRTAFRELVKRRAEGTPVAYLVGKKEFYSLEFRVDDSVLIPRPETEDLVMLLLDLIKQHQPNSSEVHALDIGTGSGCIAIAATTQCKALRFTAVDISPQALAIAQANAKTHEVENRIDFVESDLFSALSAEGQFDYLVSNPPYVTSVEMETLPRDVRDYEPHLALNGGSGGTQVIEQVLSRAGQFLKSGGYLLMEISPQINDAVRALCDAHPELELLPTVQVNRLPRIIQARRR